MHCSCASNQEVSLQNNQTFGFLKQSYFITHYNHTNDLRARKNIIKLISKVTLF